MPPALLSGCPLPPAPAFPLAFWVDDLDPFLIRFGGNFGIRYYGLGYVVGFLAGAWLLYRYARAGRSLVPASRIPDLYGGDPRRPPRRPARILFPVRRLAEFPLGPAGNFRIWDGGMASHGGMIGVTLALAWFARTQRISFLTWPT